MTDRRKSLERVNDMTDSVPNEPKPEDEDLSNKIVLDDNWQEEKSRSKRQGNSSSRTLDEEYLAL